MSPLTSRTTRRLLAAGGVATALFAPTSLAAASTPSTPSTTTAAAVSRIVVASDQAALVLDANRLSVIDTIPMAARPGLSAAGDGRHVFLTPSGKGMVQILDTGAATADARATQPHIERGVLAGVTPGHVVGEHGRTAVFDDGTGVIQVVADADLSAAALPVRAMAPYPAHHGVTVPMAKGFLTSVPAAGSTARIGVARIRENGTVAARWDTCPGLHGEGHAKVAWSPSAATTASSSTAAVQRARSPSRPASRVASRPSRAARTRRSWRGTSPRRPSCWPTPRR